MFIGGGGSSWSPKSSSKAKQNHDQNEHRTNHHKKSVLMKVKEKARKLKKSISGRKRRQENDTQSPYITLPGSAGSLDDDKDRFEYFGTPLYEPLVTPKRPDINDDSKQSGRSISTREETETTKPDAKKPENGVEENDNISSMQDKGVSMKEYIMNKFEPGEDERALSQAITQTISPKCEKVKEVVNSLLGNEEAPESICKSSNVALDTPSGLLRQANDQKLTNDPNLSNTLEPNIGSSSRTSSNLKPNSG
ncbi:uncharacterized protein LOC143576807 [Bidens hawaiensis]|uniref:uncharacterized protein LOC143576807 n=1 Tax=Bidens hawaiensis TaxID=980011 RepID=UPI0040490847